MQQLASLSDDALLRDLHVIVSSHRRVTAELILHLGEVDARRLHVEKGFSSLFSYCVELLQFSEDEACRRIEAARLARRFPAIYPLLETGTVSLTVLGLLKPHLTNDNHRQLLAGVSGSSVRHAKEWLAAWFPQPDVAWSIRKQPERCPARAEQPRVVTGLAFPTASLSELGSASPTAAVTEAGLASRTAAATQARLATPTTSMLPEEMAPKDAELVRAASPASARAKIEPLSRDRFLVKFTASRPLREKLEVASDLMRHAIPNGDLAVILERAVDLLIAELEKKKQGRTSRPHTKPRSAKETHVTSAARREVVGCDGWRCSFVAEDGRRCNAQAFLEFDHKTPKGRRGSSQAKNLRILCQAHNRLAAERAYGKAHVSRAISAASGKAGESPARRASLKICPLGPSHP